jgi:C-terminal processing protease CtpA/Prc
MRLACLFILISFLFSIDSVFADSIFMKNSNKIKGLVIEEYKDRILLNTVDGEKFILRKDIEKIEYDTLEQNFMQLGRAYDLKSWYDKASFYYKKAMEANPDFKEAREAYLASLEKVWHQDEKAAQKELDRHVTAINWWQNRDKTKVFTSEDKIEVLKKTLGFVLVEENGIFRVAEIIENSAADKNEIKKGDNLVGIWGRLITYSKMSDVLNELLGPNYSEVKIMIERNIDVPAEDNIENLYKELGVLLGFEYEGLKIIDIIFGKKAQRFGFKKGDYLVSIGKNSTRYLPMDQVIMLINNQKDDVITFAIRRNINLRRQNAAKSNY